MELNIQQLIETLRMYYSFKDGASLSVEQATESFRKKVVKSPGDLQYWVEFVEQLKKLLPYCRFRDFGYQHDEPSFRVQVGLNDRQGLCYCVSLLGPYIGYYYCNANSNNTNIYSVHPIFIDTLDNKLSYCPYNREQKFLSEEINTIANNFFKERIIFSPDVSVLPVENVTIEGLHYKRVQLFHLYFTHYINGLI